MTLGLHHNFSINHGPYHIVDGFGEPVYPYQTSVDP